jgi:hypothetical protein
VWPEGLGKFKISSHRVSNPLSSSLQHSAITTLYHMHPLLTTTIIIIIIIIIIIK